MTCAPKMILQILRAAGMIDVAMTHDDVLDFLRIQSDLRQAIGDFVFNRIIENRIDNDDAVRSVDSPGRILRHPHEVQIIEDLYRLGMPLLTIRRSLRL